MRTTKSKSQVLFEKSKQIYFNCSSLGTATRCYNKYIFNQKSINYHLYNKDIVEYVASLVYKPNAFNINLDYINKFVDLSFSFFLDNILKYHSRFMFLNGSFKSFLKKIIYHEIYSYNQNTKEFDFVPFDFESFFK